jgi:hypothetical protein
VRDVGDVDLRASRRHQRSTKTASSKSRAVAVDGDDGRAAKILAAG